MPQKKQQCRFRIPWISGPSTGSKSRPKQRSKHHAQLDTKAPIERPPFQPHGVASAPTSEPQQLSTSLSPPSPASSVILESPLSSPSESPTHHPSPSHAGRGIKVPPDTAAEESTQAQSEPKMKSPLKAAENFKAPLETLNKSHPSKPETKPIKIGKGNEVKHGQSIQRPKAELHTTASASASRVHTKETVERKMMFATSSPSQKDIKVVTSTSAEPVTRNVSTLSNEEKSPMQTGTKDDVSSFVHKLANVNPMDDKTVSVVTLAGENRGATMHVAGSHSQSSRKKGSIHTEGEEKEKDETGKAYVNSNIQSMNNSLMSHGSINERDPGVRVILPQQADDKLGLENHKAEVKINRAERSTYQPVVRRRCLRGLFLEPSDSDPDKPRRHGCKFSCGEIRKDKDTEVM